MNIQEYMAESRANMLEHNAFALLERRRNTFLGYCETEKGRGGIDPDIPLNMPKGQEQVRVLFARCLEEILEALDSREIDHYKEELIDALNFGTSMLFFFPKWRENENLVELAEILDQIPHMVSFSVNMPPSTLFMGVAKGYSRLLEKLRNRAWQKRTQQPYFTGETDMLAAIQNLWMIVAGEFDSWEEFCSFFLAKDEVLKFRLRTKY